VAIFKKNGNFKATEKVSKIQKLCFGTVCTVNIVYLHGLIRVLGCQRISPSAHNYGFLESHDPGLGSLTYLRLVYTGDFAERFVNFACLGAAGIECIFKYYSRIFFGDYKLERIHAVICTYRRTRPLQMFHPILMFLPSHIVSPKRSCPERILTFLASRRLET